MSGLHCTILHGRIDGWVGEGWFLYSGIYVATAGARRLGRIRLAVDGPDCASKGYTCGFLNVMISLSQKFLAHVRLKEVVIERCHISTDEATRD